MRLHPLPRFYKWTKHGDRDALATAGKSWRRRDVLFEPKVKEALEEARPKEAEK